MYTRVREILERNYVDLLAIPPSSTLKDARRAIQRAEMEAEMSVSAVDTSVIEGAKAVLSSEERLLEYRILARWAGDDRLARWAPAHDAALKALRDSLGRSPSAAVRAVRAWLEAHRDPSLASVLNIPIGRDGLLWWAGEVAEDYLSSFLIPGTPTMTAYELGTLVFSPFPAAAERVVMKFVQCRLAAVEQLSGLVPEFRGGDVDRQAAWQASGYRDELKWMLDNCASLERVIDRWDIKRAERAADLTDAFTQLANRLGGVALHVALYCIFLGDQHAGKELITKLRHVAKDSDLQEAADLILARVRQVNSLPYRARVLASRVFSEVAGLVVQVAGLVVLGAIVTLLGKACDSGS